ncbi:DUF7519 family protein [Halosimplex salinum]|uniref:DUF7519 family protein n=1 Tax=Halosimplex salinum TaxID=1710538 RepID=UPI000F488D76|nr:hypothetical protein [Halosimplex salinum]
MTDRPAQGEADERPSSPLAKSDATAGASAFERPSRVSAAIVLVVSMVAAVALMAQVGPTLSVVVAVVDAAAFAGSLWLVGRDRWRTLATTTAGVLALFVGAGFAFAVGYTFLALVASLFPVASIDQIRPRGLRIVSASLVVLGGTVAAVGALSTLSDALHPERAWAHAKLTVKTFVVPLLVAALVLLSTLLDRLGETGDTPVLGGPADALGGVLDAFLSPVPGRTHLLTFSLLLGAAAVAVARGVRSLPAEELSTPRTDDRVERALESVRAAARRIAVVTAFVLPVTLVEVVVQPADLRALVTPPVYGLLTAVTASGVLRLLLVGAVVLGGGAVATTVLLRRTVRTEARDVALALTPFLGGATVVALAVALHGAVLPPTLEFVTAALPGEFATAFSRQSGAIVEFYGSLAVVVTVAAMLVGMTALLSLTLALVSAVGALPETAPAPALAAAGTFVAAAFAAGAGVGAPLVLGGLVASIVVWDAGEFGATLGREIGPSADTTGPEFVHVGASVAVGALGALGAVAVHRVSTAATLTDVTTIPFALAVVVAGLLLLVVALR